VQINKISGARRVLTGNLGSTEGFIDFPQSFVRDGDYLYFSSQAGFQRVFLGADGKSSLETVVAQSGLAGCCDLKSLSGNDTHMFWTMSDGRIYRKSYANDNPAELIATINDGGVYLVHLSATASQLYVATVPNLNTAPSVVRIDLSSLTMEPLQRNVTLNFRPDLPTALSSTHFYWMNGSTLYRVAHTESVPEIVISGMTNITDMSADDSFVYALQNGAPNIINEVNLSTKTSTPVVSMLAISDLLRYQGKLYWIADPGLFTLNPDGTTSQPFVTQGSGFSVGHTGGVDMVGVANKVVVSGGGVDGKILFYDTGTGESTVLQVRGNFFPMSSDSHSVYYGSFNTGIIRIPADLNIRRAQTLFTRTAFGFGKFVLSNGWVYWEEHSPTGENRIVKALLDGTQLQVFIDGSRGLESLNGRLYFMCQSACSSVDWSLASMSTTDDIPVPEFGLGRGPRHMVQRNGVFYVADTLDGFSLNVFSINLDLNGFSKLVSGLPNSFITLDASPRWLYRSQDYSYLVRHKINAWNNVGAGQVIESFDLLNGRDVIQTSVHTDGQHVYYWYIGVGLKRVSEQ